MRNYFPTVLKEFPHMLSTCWLCFLHSAVQLIPNHLNRGSGRVIVEARSSDAALHHSTSVRKTLESQYTRHIQSLYGLLIHHVLDLHLSYVLLFILHLSYVLLFSLHLSYVPLFSSLHPYLLCASSHVFSCDLTRQNSFHIGSSGTASPLCVFSHAVSGTLTRQNSFHIGSSGSTSPMCVFSHALSGVLTG
ncbi:hypothetical protein J4Q44_G00293000 [Coregonus suidteri]|uniref:Uncharacterized protein n=1 Tax=Coregonus suidteri TaxID=861788 RepID=A0AAN8KYG0_9TELE